MREAPVVIKKLTEVNLLNLLEHADIGVVIHTKDTAVVYANPTALRLLRLSFSQMIGKDALDPQWQFIDEHHLPLPLDEYPVYRVLNHEQPLHNQVLGLVDGHHNDVTWFSISGYYEGNKDTDDGFIVISFVDITDKKIQFSFEDIVQNTQDIVIVTEADNINRPFGPKIVYVNPAFEKLTGYKAEEVIGETPRILQGQDTDKETLIRIRTALEQQTPCSEVILNYAKDGRPYWLDINIIPLTNRFGEVTHFAAIERDITSRIHFEKAMKQRNNELNALKKDLQKLVEEKTEALRQTNLKLHRIAHEDSLTGIPNRMSFMMQAEQQLARAKRGSLTIGVAILDVDYFKRINDTFGHDVGDKALQFLTHTMRNSLRQEDVIGRLGGEEFAICILSSSDQLLVDSLNRLREEIRTRSEELEFGSISVSIGLNSSQGKEAPDLKQMIKNADLALYQAKDQGRNRVCSYDENLSY